MDYYSVIGSKDNKKFKVNLSVSVKVNSHAPVKK